MNMALLLSLTLSLTVLPFSSEALLIDEWMEEAGVDNVDDYNDWSREQDDDREERHYNSGGRDSRDNSKPIGNGINHTGEGHYSAEYWQNKIKENPDMTFNVVKPGSYADVGTDTGNFVGRDKDGNLIYVGGDDSKDRDRDDDRDDEPKKPTPPGGNEDEDPITPPHRPITPNPTEVYPIVPPVTPPGGPSPNPLIPPVKPPIPPKPPKPPYPGDTSSVVPNPGPCTNSVTWTETTYTYDATSNSDK